MVRVFVASSDCSIYYSDSVHDVSEHIYLNLSPRRVVSHMRSRTVYRGDH